MPLYHVGVGSYRGPGRELRTGQPAGSSLPEIGQRPLADTTKIRAMHAPATVAATPARRPGSASTLLR
jgi:hypothetical protein